MLHQRAKQEIEDRITVILSRRQAFKQNVDIGTQARAKRTRDRIEAVIKFEEDRQRAILEQERLAKEAEERKAQEEEKQRQLALAKQKEEKLKQEVLKAKQDAEKQKQEQENKEKSEKEAAHASLGLSTPSNDWVTARNLLKVCGSHSLWPCRTLTVTTAGQGWTTDEGEGKPGVEDAME